MSSPVTKHLEGKNRRTITPELRILIEEKLFVDGVIPEAFQNRRSQDMACLVAEALAKLNITEVGGNNRGEKVGMVQSVIGGVAPGGDGLAWCMSTCQVIVAFVEDFLQVASPVPASEGVLDVYQAARKIKGLVSGECEFGTICCAQHGETWMGHAMFVLNKYGKTMATFEGNTGSDGSRDGDGAYIKTRNQYQNGSLKTLGFVRLYPNNQVPK